MPEQACKVALRFLAGQLRTSEVRLSKDRERKKSGNSTGNPRKRNGNSVEIPDSRAERGNISLTGFEDNPPDPLTGHFKTFWLAYPKRDGINDPMGASKAFPAAVERAGGHEVITAAAVAYATYCREKGNVGTRYVKAPRTWLNDDLWREWLPKADAKSATTTSVPVFENTPAWEAWCKHLGKRPPTTDIRIPGQQIRRGWHFPTEFPPKEAAA